VLDAPRLRPVLLTIVTFVTTPTEPDLINEMNAAAAGKPIGRPAEVNIRNNHVQYIVTWFVYPPSLFTVYKHHTDAHIFNL
jgi:cytochrome oxidase assembly protein ShyY1